jgi:hypothetical protein
MTMTVMKWFRHLVLVEEDEEESVMKKMERALVAEIWP